MTDSVVSVMKNKPGTKTLFAKKSLEAGALRVLKMHRKDGKNAIETL